MGRTPGDFVEDRSAPGTGPVARDAVVPTYKKPSTAQLIIGTLGDTLSQWGGGKGTFLPGLAEQRKAALESQQYQMQRADKFTDWKAQQDYERANPKAPADDVFMRTLQGAGIDPASPQGVALFRQRAESLANPAQYVSNGPGMGGQFVRPNAAVAPPQAPIGKLTPLGGGAPSQGARTFPVR